MSILPLTLVSFKAIVDHGFKLWEGLKREIVHYLIYVLHVSSSFGWLAYLEVAEGSKICGLKQVDVFCGNG